MTSFVTREYDFYEAITNNMNLESEEYRGFNIINTERVLDNAYIVRTSHGNFLCESFEDEDATIYMRVSTYF